MNLRETIPNAFNSDKFKDNPNYYLRNDLYYCLKCDTQAQCKVKNVNGELETVNCLCKCEAERIEKEKKEFQTATRERYRKKVFSKSECEKTFENSKYEISKVAIKYAKSFISYLNGNNQSSFNGLLFYGRTGGGKTYTACAIGNEIITQGFSCRNTSFSDLQDLKINDTRTYYDTIENPSLLILDDLGVERKSEYMQEIVYQVINTRYKDNLPMIITTNLTLEEMKNATDLTQRRIYDRILEKCYPVEFKENIRQKIIGG